jgi:hypothetical protein
MFKSGLSLNSTFPSNYIALENENVSGASIDIDAVKDSGGANILIEQNKILNQNFKTIIFIIILGIAVNYFLTKR